MYPRADVIVAWLQHHGYKRDIQTVHDIAGGRMADVSMWKIKRLWVLVRQYETETRKIENVAQA